MKTHMFIHAYASYSARVNQQTEEILKFFSASAVSPVQLL